MDFLNYSNLSFFKLILNKEGIPIVNNNKKIPAPTKTAYTDIISNKYPNNNILSGKDTWVNVFNILKTLPWNSWGMFSIDQLDRSILHIVIEIPIIKKYPANIIDQIFLVNSNVNNKPNTKVTKDIKLIEFLAIFKVFWDLIFDEINEPNNKPIAKILSFKA